jgi:ribonuclease HI
MEITKHIVRADYVRSAISKEYGNLISNFLSKDGVRLQKGICMNNYLTGHPTERELEYTLVTARTNPIKKLIRKHSTTDLRTAKSELVTCTTSASNMEELHRGNSKAIMVDFANKHIGGGVLKRFGAVQEEIMFCQFCELLHAMTIHGKLESNEVMIVKGLRWVNDTKGYKQDFRYEKEHSRQDTCSYNVLIMDAKDFRDNPQEQYTPENTMRDLLKAFIGFYGALRTGHTNIITGRWGCGCFGGDLTHKIRIQILAMTLATIYNDDLNTVLTFAYVSEKEMKMAMQGITTVGDLWESLREFVTEPVCDTTNVYELYVDGGSRGNPGSAGCGGVIYDHTKPVLTFYKYLGNQTNNVAEYEGLITGLTHALAKGIKNIKVYADSQLMVFQINGKYKVKNEVLANKHSICSSLIAKFDSFTIDHCYREANKVADALANKAMDTKSEGVN